MKLLRSVLENLVDTEFSRYKIFTPFLPTKKLNIFCYKKLQQNPEVFRFLGHFQAFLLPEGQQKQFPLEGVHHT